MSADLHVVPPIPPSQAIIELLQGLLSRAISGEIKAIAVAVHSHPIATATTFEIGPGGDVAHLVCALERIKLRVLAHGGGLV